MHSFQAMLLPVFPAVWQGLRGACCAFCFLSGEVTRAR
ncbi:hypothetical protein AmDm5_0844 [Acetobacter malorum]|nr:hypothetical protein AmDm5_0844 [Acetobacter malorum]